LRAHAQSWHDADACKALSERLEPLLEKERASSPQMDAVRAAAGRDGLKVAATESHRGVGWLAQVHKQQRYIVPPSQWIIGGDGWAYDIGYGGIAAACGRRG
jgi:pyruvate-ferredoxin/flavodoxin oxidoreductase